MSLDIESARIVLDRAHRAWCARDLTGVFDCYADDLVYQCNVGPDGAPLTLNGKAEMEAMLRPILAVADSMSVIDKFQLQDGTGRARVSCFVRHRATGLTLSGTFRQIVTFRGSLIHRLQEFHDGARLAAFWRLVAAETQSQVLVHSA